MTNDEWKTNLPTPHCCHAENKRYNLHSMSHTRAISISIKCLPAMYCSNANTTKLFNSAAAHRGIRFDTTHFEKSPIFHVTRCENATKPEKTSRNIFSGFGGVSFTYRNIFVSLKTPYTWGTVQEADKNTQTHTWNATWLHILLGNEIKKARQPNQRVIILLDDLKVEMGEASCRAVTCQFQLKIQTKREE